jgi:hypothetical protein
MFRNYQTNEWKYNRCSYEAREMTGRSVEEFEAAVDAKIAEKPGKARWVAADNVHYEWSREYYSKR